MVRLFVVLFCLSSLRVSLHEFPSSGHIPINEWLLTDEVTKTDIVALYELTGVTKKVTSILKCSTVEYFFAEKDNGTLLLVASATKW